jgi:hypothetical protein
MSRGSFLRFGLWFAGSLALGFVAGSKGPPAKTKVAQAVPRTAADVTDDVREQTGQPMPPVAFDWSNLESTNYQEFTANLRTTGCPETTIIAIIKADLNRLYAPKFGRAATAGNFANGRRQPALRLQRERELENEIDSILYQQLGLQRPPRFANLLFKAEQQARIAEAQVLFPPAVMSSTNSDAMEQSKQNKEARLQFLSSYLSPQQLLYYKLEREGGALQVHSLLMGIRPNKEEFLRVAAALDENESIGLGGFSDPQVSKALQKGLSPERFELLKSIRQPNSR